MSPSNINSFVGDLVQMAQAMEQLPKVEQELEQAKNVIENYAKANQGLELNIIGYKDEIEALHAKVRSLEVERDDASFRVLEAEDREHVALNMARSIASAVGNVINTLDPPKPEPIISTHKQEPVPQAQPTAKGSQSAASPTGEQQAGSQSPMLTATDGEQKSEQTSVTSTASGDATSAKDWQQDKAETSILPPGQSESSPTVKAETTSSETASSHSVQPTVADTTAGSVDPGPALGPYFGKRYTDIPGRIDYSDWLAGGGTYDNYWAGRS